MTKAELIAKIAEKKGGSKKDAEESLKAVFEATSESLLNGEAVAVPGFGTFKVKVSSEREGVNPQTGAKVHIPSKKGVGFKVSKTLKGELNK